MQYATFTGIQTWGRVPAMWGGKQNNTPLHHANVILLPRLEHACHVPPHSYYSSYCLYWGVVNNGIVVWEE